MKLRCKFRLMERTECYGGHFRLRFAPIVDKSIPEEMRFSTKVPSGHVEMNVDADSPLVQIAVGDVFEVDFSSVETVPPA